MGGQRWTPDARPRMQRLRALAAAAIGTLALAGTATASAATPFGLTFEPSTLYAPNYTAIQSGSPGGQYAAPVDGVITAWRFQASAANVPQGLKLKIARPVAGETFIIVGESAFEIPAPEVLNSFTDVRIPVRTGDVLGMYAAGAANVAVHDAVVPAAGYVFTDVNSDVAPGTTVGFDGPYGDRQLDLSATVETDCDGDGFGDETQDSDTSPCTARTLSLDASKSKVKKGKKVEFSGTIVNGPLNPSGCAANQAVELQRRRLGQDFTTVAQLQTAAAGEFSTELKLKQTHEYRAQAAATATCGASVSGVETVKVKKRK